MVQKIKRRKAATVNRFPISGKLNRSMRTTLLYLPDADHRNELMIIYVEDGKTAQVTAADTAKSAGQARWKPIEDLSSHISKG